MDPIRSKTTRVISVLALAAVLVLVASPAALGAAQSSGLRVVGFQVSGNVVSVSVHNAETATVHGTVAVQAIVDDTPIWGYSSITVSAGGTTTVAVSFGGLVQQVIQVGTIQDDGSPL